VTLAGCGSDNSSSSAGSSSSGGLGPDGVHVSGAVGTSATVKFDGKITDSSSTTKVLSTGDGAKLGVGDSAVIHTVLADGSTQKTVENTYTEKRPALVTVTSQTPQLFRDALVGKTVGSRVLVYAPASQVFNGTPDPSSGIGSNDVLAVVVDIVDQPLTGPDGSTHQPPAWAPKIQTDSKGVSGLDFAGTPKPDGRLHVAVLRKGTGPTVKKGQLLGVKYFGAIYKGKKPFDQNFDGAPVGFPIGVQQVVPGWDKTLVGQKVGSEVVLQIPPKDGYGKKAQQNIPANSTLYFVVDILSAD
jgi:FKBP-type peptidyl-prolyl isomerase-like protein